MLVVKNNRFKKMPNQANDKLDRPSDTKESFPFKQKQSHLTKKDNLPYKPFSAKNKVTLKEKPRTYLLHKISFAIISALTIGLMSGFIMLHLLAEPEETANDFTETPTVAKPSETTDDETVQYEFPALQAFTLQMGVFAEKANAEQLSESLLEEDLPAIVWPKEEQYYVLSGLAVTKEQAKDLNEQIEDSTVESFVKEWQTEAFEQAITADEQQWIELFVEQWNETINKTENDSTVKEPWQTLIDQYPEQSTLLLPLKEAIESFVNHELNDRLQIDYNLKNIWLAYTNL